MKFRVINGQELVGRLKQLADWTIFQFGEDVRVEVESDAISGRSAGGCLIVCLGKVYGRRDETGFLSDIDSLEAFLVDMVDHTPLSDIAAQLEGKFLLIALSSDGVCRVCADRFAKTEVFIQHAKGGVALASDLSLLPDNPAEQGFDQAALAHMLTYYGYCPPKRHTIYKGVRRLGVGDTAILNHGNISITTKAFTPVKISEYGEEEHHKYADLFLAHLKKVGSTDGNVVYLSSGWDSTAILAGLVHVFGAEKVRCVTGRMRYSERSGVCNQFEIDRATKMADYYGVKLDIVDFEYLEHGQEFVCDMLPTMKANQLYSLNCISHGKLAEKVKETSSGHEVVFAGEISDGAHNLGFSQYATIFHPSYGFREYSDKMASYLFGPTFLSLFEKDEYEQDPIYNLFRSRAGEIKFDCADSDLSKRPMQLFTSFFLRNGRMPLWSLDNVKLLTSEGQDVYTKEMQTSYLADAAEQATPENIYAWYLHLYNSFHWQGSTVRTLPVLADQYGLETDMPYWDGGIQDFLAGMPEEWGRGLDLNPTKFPLKWVLKNKIDYPYELQTGPHAYTYDVDHSFNHLEEVFCHSKMTAVLQQALSGKSYREVLSPDVFNIAYIDSLVDDYTGNKTMNLSSLADLVPIAMLCLIGWYGKK